MNDVWWVIVRLKESLGWLMWMMVDLMGTCPFKLDEWVE